MEEIKLTFENLLNDSPVDEANRHQAKDHISRLIEEELVESRSGVIYTDKDYRTLKVGEAAINGVKERVGRWAQLRNDLMLKVKHKQLSERNSEFDVNQKKLLESKEEQKSAARDVFMQDNHYVDLKRDHEQTKQRYETMRAEMGGKPPVKRKLSLYMISILLIGFIEWFINYSTFNMKYPPGIAFGVTVLIAISIALASHFHGALLKQRVALFATHRRKEHKRQELIYQSFFTLLLVIAMAIVTYNRYDLLVDQLINSGGASLPGLAGQEQGQSSVWSELWPFILMNLLVWIVGVAISYFTHDSQPDYQEALSDYSKAKGKYHKVDKGLKEEENRIEQEFEVKFKANSNSQASHVDISKQLNSLVERLIAKEQSLIAQAVSVINETLEKHQTMLVTALRQHGFEDVKVGPDQLSINQYKERDVTVDAYYVRKVLSMELV